MSSSRLGASGYRYVFSSDPGSEMLEQLTSVSYDSLVVVNEALPSETQQGHVLAELSADLDPRFTEPFALRYLNDGRTLSVLVETDNGLIAEMNAAVSEFIDRRSDLPAPPEVDVSLGQASGSEFVAVTGGHTIRAANANGVYSRCTAGFTAKDLITETEGVLTAGHCPDDAAEYDGSRGVLNFFRRATGQVDSQFFMTVTPAHATTKQFTNGLGGAVDVQSVGNPSVGDYVCKYGYATARTCG